MVGESDLGFPSTFGNAMWMVVPDKLAQYILERIFKDLEKQTFSLGFGPSIFLYSSCFSFCNKEYCRLDMQEFWNY